MLTGERLYLGPLEKSDSDQLFDWINDRRLVMKNSNYKPIDRLSHENWLNSIVKNELVRIFAIRKKEDDNLVGTCQLYAIDWINSSAELQIRIGSQSERGKGIGTEAVFLLLSYGFEDLNMHRIYLNVYEENLAAIKVYKKNGFSKEGLLRQSNYINGEYVNVMVMAILREEWIKQRNL